MSSDDSHPTAELADIHLAELPRSAGGLGAITSTTGFLSRETGLVRGGKALLRMNQEDGFDCPGCAWPEPEVAARSRLEFCENGAKALAEEATTRRATAELFAERSIDELRACSDFELGQLGRLTEPLLLDAGSRHYRPVAWDQALALLADEMRAAGPAATALYASGRTSNEAAFLYQLVGRWFGTNNFPDCSNLCHESSGVALTEVIGVGKGTVSLHDFDHAELILVIGQNPGTNHPRMLTTLREAAQRGATIVSINPLQEVGLARFSHPQKVLDVLGGGVALAKEFVQVKIGGDLALLRGMAKVALEEDARSLGSVIDRSFVRERTSGFIEWRELTLATQWSQIVEQSGVSEEQIRRIADLYIRSRATIACWAMGLTQHKHAVATIQEIVNLLLLRGNLGRPGAGVCPVRGHSNVQGDRTMGITTRPRPEFLDALARSFSFTPPREPGLDTVDSIQAMQEGRVTCFVALGGNFLSAAPDTAATTRALEQCQLTASISTKLNRTHLHPGGRALILPCLGRSEIDLQGGVAQFVTVEDSMSMVHRSTGVLEPASPHLHSEPAIVAALGQHLLGDVLDWQELAGNYDRIRDLIADVIPGCDDYNSKVRTPGGFQLPSSVRDGSFSQVAGRARFAANPLPELHLPAGHLRMMTIRSHDQYNTTIYGLDDRYRGVHGERRVVFVSSEDMVALGLVERQVVDLVSSWSDGERRAPRFIVVPFAVPQGCCATYFPEANVLVPLGSVADKSNTPTSKSVAVRIVPTEPVAAAR
jgi:molybdopterin-dependent oxidoreductase alpha subunit